tara:strand:+ start:1246 stop:1479 length:234 start_codon:yes stop_codon:yes gene_type:complete
MLEVEVAFLWLWWWRHAISLASRELTRWRRHPWEREWSAEAEQNMFKPAQETEQQGLWITQNKFVSFYSKKNHSTVM